jgi:flagellar biosynthesis/type III secretory pathway protein FliH
LDFFANAHKKTPEDVEKLHTPEVKQAYERMKLSNFPHELRRSYIDASNDYALYSQRIARERAEGREEGSEEGRVEGAREEREKLLEKITDLVKSG